MRHVGAAVLFLVASWIASTQADALPVFAHRYGLTCGTCHSTVPHLSAFGNAFLRAGFRPPPGFERQPDVFPVAMKINLQYSSFPDPNGLPKAIVDEVELLSSGPLARHYAYRMEQYIVDGGEPGLTRDAWLAYASRPAFGDTAPSLRFTAGQFTLPLPVDPETQRETINHYLIYDQQVGNNPFDFFNDGIGVDAAYGRQVNGSEVELLVLKGHDPLSGLPTSGASTMTYAQTTASGATFSLYALRGMRSFGSVTDEFYRESAGLTFVAGKLQTDLVAQRGGDGAADFAATPASSGGGFAQARWAFSPAVTALARYDFTSDTFVGAQHSLTATLVVRVQRNSKVTIEDVSASGHQTFNAAYLFAY